MKMGGLGTFRGPLDYPPLEPIQACGFERSMSRSGRRGDNAVAELFCWSLEPELPSITSTPISSQHA